MINKWMDIGTSQAIKTWMQSKLTDFSEVREVQLDSKAQKCSVTLLPHGEMEEILFTVTEYEVLKEDEQHYVQVKGVACSRVWIENLAIQFLIGQKFSTPSLVAKLL